MPRYRRHELEDALAESLATPPDRPAVVPDPLPLVLRRVQERRRRWAWLRDLAEVLRAPIAVLGLLFAALFWLLTWRLWP